ncbi:hypothetical protein [Actinoallomurus sp. NPDC050550]|uniref:hypothetical protein n=1 Tax=Actinoallomurus sp. NPDC050550 TaxID=3154937 RepID=UPI0033F4A790
MRTVAVRRLSALTAGAPRRRIVLVGGIIAAFVLVIGGMTTLFTGGRGPNGGAAEVAPSATSPSRVSPHVRSSLREQTPAPAVRTMSTRPSASGRPSPALTGGTASPPGRDCPPGLRKSPAKCKTRIRQDGQD